MDDLNTIQTIQRIQTNQSNKFSLQRFWAIVIKEFIQMRRDRLTFAMIIGIPLIQLIFFGFAINTNPKDLPTAVEIADNSIFSRSYYSNFKELQLF